MDSDPSRRAQEHLAASVVLAGLSSTGANKHRRSDEDDDDDSPEAAAGGSMKKIRAFEAPAAVAAVAVQAPTTTTTTDASRGELQPYPFFYYTDYSKEEDLDSLTPLTPPGRVPNFPAKMHAIMSRPDLADVICWMDHGRSWKVMKPREFEIRVIPTYFEHAKFSSFIRQANGWGFRRITTGRDRNSYYHPLFLRSMPHLCKNMKRPGVSKKLAADPEHEPDLYKISELHPVPNTPVDDSILLQCTLQGGPKARMPIYSGILTPSTAPMVETQKVCGVSMSSAPSDLTPSDHETLASFQAAIGDFSAKTSPATTTKTIASSEDSKQPAVPAPKPASTPTPSVPFIMPPFMMPPAVSAFTPSMTFPNMASHGSANPTLSALVAANQMAFANPAAPNTAAASVPAANPFAALQANAAASQFAAGFAAAAAFNQQQMQTMLQTMQQQQQQQQGGAAAKSTNAASQQQS